MATSITFGSDTVNYQTVHADSYKRLVSSSADRAAFKENAFYLRGHHFAFGTSKALGDGNPETVSKDAYRDPGKKYYENFVKEVGAKAEQKAAVQKANFTLGCDEDPNRYKSIHTLEICEPGKITREKGDTTSGKPQLRGHNFCLGSDRMDYTSTAGAAHIHFKDVDRGPDLKERTRALRLSSFVFGNDEVDYESAATAAYNTGVGDMPRDQAAEGTGKEGVRGVNFKYNNTPVDYRSEHGRSYSQVEELNAHCRNPTRLDASTRKDLRSHHFDFGSDKPAYQSLGQESFGAKKGKDQEEVLKEMNHLSSIKKDLRATHISLGQSGQSKLEGVTASRAAYVAPTAKQLGQAHEDRTAVQDQGKGVHFTLGTDDEELKRIRSITLAQDSMRQGVSGVDYADRSSQDKEFTADLKKCHFYLGTGQGADQWQSTAAANYVEHKDFQRQTMSAEVKKDLRASHYQLGGEEGYPKDMKSTQQDMMSYYGPAPHTSAVDERSNATNFVLGNTNPVYRSTAADAYSWPTPR